MRDISSTFIEEKNKQENQPIFLYTIFEYDGSSNLYLAEYDVDIIFDGQTYFKFPIKHDFISETNSGEVSKVTLSIGNVSRLIQAYLENYDLRGKKVLIRVVWANQLADIDAKLDNYFYIDRYIANVFDATFELSNKFFDVLDIKLPGRPYSRNYCTYKLFKGTECGYSGSEISCNRMLTRCIQLGNRLRFGGQPSIPSRRLFV